MEKRLYKSIMENLVPMPHGSKLHTSHTSYHLLAAEQELHKQRLSLKKNIGELSGKKVRRRDY